MHRHQMALDQLRLAGWGHADGDVGLAHAEVELPVVEQKIDGDIGVDLEELAHPGREPGRAEGHRGRHLQLALGPVLAFRQLSFGHGELGEDFMGGAVEQFALLGQDQAARVPVKQGDVEAFLERADLAADGRLAEVQGFARMGETPGLGDGVEYPELVPVHYSAATLLPSRRVSGLDSDSAAPARNRSASSAAMQPMPAAVTA